MSEIEDMINNVLSNPDQMEKLTGLAKSLMGSPSAQDTPAQSSPDLSGLIGSLTSGGSPDFGFDPAMLAKLTQLMNSDNENNRHEQALLEAMKPYLSEKRRGKMDKAMRIAKLTRIAKLAFGDFGGGDSH